MFSSKSHTGYIEVLDGIKRKTLVFGEKTLMTEFLLEKGKVLPMHRHPQEQTGFLFSGKIVLTIGEEEFHVNPGDSWTIPGDVEHGARVLEDSVAVEVFSPVRDDYLPQVP
jgi:quercetin dioxygenase-like cupin family protein